MEPLGDDDLLYIFDKIPSYSDDKKPFPQVSKQFMKVACIRLRRLYCCFPGLLFDILPSSTNMRTFLCYKPLSDAHLKLLAHSCPKILDLMLFKNPDPSSEPEPGEFESDFGFDDDGLCAVANSCIHLRCVNLSSGLNHVGDAGIVSLVTSCKNLIKLNLEGCIRVTDESLKVIGESGIRSLNLGGCDRITGDGVLHLKEMVGLTRLNLSNCGVHVTDAVIVALSSQLPNIEELDLSWLINVTDISLLAIGSKCLKLKDIYLTGCEAITAEGLRAFSGHRTLERLELFSCYNFSWEDVESVVLTCIKLQYLGLMRRIKTPMPEGEFDYFHIGHTICKLGWDEAINIPFI